MKKFFLILILSVVIFLLPSKTDAVYKICKINQNLHCNPYYMSSVKIDNNGFLQYSVCVFSNDDGYWVGKDYDKFMSFIVSNGLTNECSAGSDKTDCASYNGKSYKKISVGASCDGYLKKAQTFPCIGDGLYHCFNSQQQPLTDNCLDTDYNNIVDCISKSTSLNAEEEMKSKDPAAYAELVKIKAAAEIEAKEAAMKEALKYPFVTYKCVCPVAGVSPDPCQEKQLYKKNADGAADISGTVSVSDIEEFCPADSKKTAGVKCTVGIGECATASSPSGKEQLSNLQNQASKVLNPAKFLVLGKNGLAQLMGKAINFLMFPIAMFVMAMYIWAGVLWATSSGNSESVGKAKQILVWSTLGLIVTLGSYLIVKTIFSLF